MSLIVWSNNRLIYIDFSNRYRSLHSHYDFHISRRLHFTKCKLLNSLACITMKRLEFKVFRKVHMLEIGLEFIVRKLSILRETLTSKNRERNRVSSAIAQSSGTHASKKTSSNAIDISCTVNIKMRVFFSALKELVA